ncbi:phosphorylase [Brumimicrobium salinarum]|uniref:Uridine phosphorylase n=1 Tax=Brumimicrobium salinarum TaxID=2058658 RepID=A0A2I0R350_9FLAO|nr:nucleoside phosphorylase [Brumimicrobium salinarum]PKR80996.1 phosphorylase [Brumimicrobium salinarum]
MADYLPSELVITPKGGVYHLDICPEDIAHKIIVVGDQDRVELVSKFFDEVTHKSQHREFACHTGNYKGKSLSVISTGIGTDNIDIVINELDALVNIDLETRNEKSEKTVLEIVRLGTCGILQDEIPIDSFILSTHALGIDNVGHFYERNVDEKTERLALDIESKVKLPKYVKPYLTPASKILNDRLLTDDIETGITVTSSGFYGPQGRRLRLPLVENDMLDSFSDFKHDEVRIANLEMECSALFSLSSALGHQATAICLGLANRRKKQFTKNYDEKIIELIKHVLEHI